LLPPPGKADHFKYNGPTSIALDMGVGETLRKAITDIYANDSFPRQVYGFSFAIRGPNNALTVPYPLRTIRGAAVASATWALYLPVVVALIWSALFALVLPRLSSPGAWRRTVPAALPGGDIAHE
jgi:hypothetical protein